MTHRPHDVVAEFAQQLAGLGWVKSLHVGGSLATGDYRVGVSDLDLVAVTADLLTQEHRAALTSIHRAVAPTMKLGCTCVPLQLVDQSGRTHDTWTHGQLIRRRLSGIARAELAQHGYAVFGVEPAEVWASMSANDIARSRRRVGRLLVLGSTPTVALARGRSHRSGRHHDASRPARSGHRRAHQQVRGP